MKKIKNGHMMKKSHKQKSIDDYRKEAKNCLEKMSQPSFRYGLKITVRPEMDVFGLLDKVASNRISNSSKIISCDENIKVFVDALDEKNIIRTSEFDSNENCNKNNCKSNDNDFSTNYFGQFCKAYFNDFLFIEIPKLCDAKNPIVIDYDVTDSVVSNIFILAKKGSRTKILFNKFQTENKTDSIIVNERIRIFLEKDSKIDFLSSQTLGKKTICIQDRKAYVRENSKINWSDISIGAEFYKASTISELNGANAASDMKIVYITSENQKYDIYTGTMHNFKNTQSNTLTRGVISDRAKALSQGLVYISKAANESIGYEKQDALILSDNAEADAIPNLQIENNDVKCSHASSIGQIDEEKINYLMSRGLSEKESTKLIIEGYFQPIIDNVNDKLIEEKISSTIIKALG